MLSAYHVSLSCTLQKAQILVCTSHNPWQGNDYEYFFELWILSLCRERWTKLLLWRCCGFCAKQNTATLSTVRLYICPSPQKMASKVGNERFLLGLKTLLTKIAITIQKISKFWGQKSTFLSLAANWSRTGQCFQHGIGVSSLPWYEGTKPKPPSAFYDNYKQEKVFMYTQKLYFRMLDYCKNIDILSFGLVDTWTGKLFSCMFNHKLADLSW